MTTKSEINYLKNKVEDLQQKKKNIEMELKIMGRALYDKQREYGEYLNNCGGDDE